jgi:predicted secreted protein
MAIQNATNVAIRVGGTGAGNTIGFATSASLSVSMDLRDSTNKQSLRWQENLAGLKSFELSGDAFVDLSGDTATNVNDPFVSNLTETATVKLLPSLYTTWEAGTEVDVVFGNSGKNYTGKGIITSISIDAGVEENATYSISITGTGALVQA